MLVPLLEELGLESEQAQNNAYVPQKTRDNNY